MNPFENERKEIDEYSVDELEKLYGFDPRAYDNDFEEVEPLDDDEYMLFIAGVEPEDIEDKDSDPDDEPIQDPAVCDDGRCGPKYDDDFDVPEWPEWQEEDEIEEISTTEPLTENVLDEANPLKAVGKAVQKGFNKVTGKTKNIIDLFSEFYIVASDLNGGNIRFLDANGNTSKTAVTFNSLDAAKTAAKNGSNTAKCKAIVRGIAKGMDQLQNVDGFSTRGNQVTAPLYVYVSGKQTLDNLPKLIKSYANLTNQVGSNGNVDLQNGEGQQQEQGGGTDNAGQEQGQDGTQGTGTENQDTGTQGEEQAAPVGQGNGEGQGAQDQQGQANAAPTMNMKPQNTGRLIGSAIRQVLGRELDKTATDRLTKNILAAIRKLQGGNK